MVKRQRKNFTFWGAIPLVCGIMLFFELGGALWARIQQPEPSTAAWAVTGLFALTAIIFVATNWRWVMDFFRSIQVGIIVIVFAALGSSVGVLVPQIQGFEDPRERVVESNYDEEFKAFRWAVGYFTYHLIHPYGIGMPEVDLPREALAGLERYGQKYGREAASNRRKEMTGAFRARRKNEEIRAHIYNNEGIYKSLFDVCSVLHLNRAYKSDWYLAIMVLLFGCVLSNTFRFGWRELFTWRRMGFGLSHLGVMTILVGGAISKAYTERGIAHLEIGKTTGQYWAFFNPNKIRPLPFKLRLDDFRRDDWDKVAVKFLNEQFSSRLPRRSLWKGFEMPLDFDKEGKPAYNLRVKEKYDTVRVSEPTLRDQLDDEAIVDPGTWDPALQYRLSGEEEGRFFLFGRGEPLGGLLWHPRNLWKLKYIWAPSVKEAQVLAAEPNVTRLGRLNVKVEGAEATGESDISVREVGQTFAIGGGFNLEVTAAAGTFRLDSREEGTIPRPIVPEAPLEEQGLNTTAFLKVVITHPEKNLREERLIMNGLDYGAKALAGHRKISEVVVNLDWDFWSSPTQERYLLIDVPGEELRLLRPGVADSGREVQLGNPVELPGSYQVVFEKRVRKADFEYEFLPIVEEDFFRKGPPGVVLELDTPTGTRTMKLAAVAGADRRLIDDNVLIVFHEDDASLPYEWQSRLTVLDAQDQVMHRGEIRVNDYLYWDGWRMFQTNANQELPNYSGIGVVFDPGIPWVVIGMYIVMAGVTYALFRRLRLRKEAR